MALFLVFVIYSLGIVTAGVFFVKMVDQRARDRQRVTRRINFPADLEFERVIAFVSAFNGTMRPRGILPGGVHTLAFEMWADHDGYVHRLHIPWQHLDYIERQLYTLIPGLHLTEEEDPHRDLTWTRIREYRLTAPSRPLRIKSGEDVSHSILASVGHLQPGEKVLLQWVVTPMKPPPLPVEGEKTLRDTTGIKDLLWNGLAGGGASKQEVAERVKKAEHPNVLAAMRVAAIAPTPVRADQNIHGLLAAANQTRAPQTWFVRRWVTQAELQRRIRDVAGAVIYRCQFSAPEIAALLGLPVGRPNVSGLSPVRTRPLPASSTIPTQGRILGETTMPGKKRPVAVSYKQSVRHFYALGPNGVGKTTLLLNLIAQDMQQGYGVIVIETKATGDLYYGALDVVPDDRVDDVITVDIDEEYMPTGFNLFDQLNGRTSIDEISSIITELYSENSSRSILAPQVLHYMSHALASVPGHTFIDMPILLTPETDSQEAWRGWLIGEIKNKDVRAYMERYVKLKENEQKVLVAPVYNRTWEFTSRAEIKRVLGQRRSSFKMVDALRQNKIVLIKVSGGGVGKQASMIAGTLFANAVWSAAKQADAQRANFLYLDEFQSIARFPIGLDSMLAQARSAKLGTVLAHQHTGQLPPELRAAVMANSLTKVIFQTSSDDARVLAREFGRNISDQEFLNLPAHHAIATISTDSGVSSPVTIKTSPPPTDGKRPEELLARREEIIDMARQRYGRPLEDVELQLEPWPGKTPGGTRKQPELPPDPMRDKE